MISETYTDPDYVPRIHRAEVTGVRRLGPGMVRVTLGGADLADFPTTGVGDEYVRLFFPDSPDGVVRMPFVTERGWDYPEGVEPSAMRTYTIRGHRPGAVDIDFVLHDGGIAAAWAQEARPGQVLALNPPRALYGPPADTTHQVLVADEPALPAALRIAELTAPGIRTTLLAEIRGDGYELTAEDTEGVTYVWLRGGNGHGPSGLAAALRRLAPDADTYVWVATESRLNREIRRHLRHTRSLPAERYRCVGYWTDDAEAWRARYDAQGEQWHRTVMDLYDSDRPLEEIIDEVERMYEAAGL